MYVQTFKRTNVLKMSLVAVVAVLVACLVTMVVSVEPSEATFPGQNGKIAFVSDRDSNTEIYVMNANGTNQTNLTNNAADDSAPTWSPNGSKLAFSASRDGNGEIYVMNADGSNQTNLTNHEFSDGRPVWSPDGTKILFTSDREWDGDAQELFTMNPDGTDQKYITKTGNNPYTPDYSPDGTKIAFVDQSYGLVYVVNADGSNLTNLTNDPVEYSFSPDWSPDGTRIVYDTEPDLDPDTNNNEIYVINADGSNLANISNNAASDYQPVWQPLPTNTAPTITSLRPPPGSSTTDRTPTIAATVTDQQTNLAKSNITLVLDDVAIPRSAYSYNLSTDRMIYTPQKNLSFGKHAIKVIALDGSGLSTTKRWSFEIVHP